MQAHERFGDGSVVQVALDIDVEAITTEAITDRTGFDARQVHTACRELLEHCKQRTWNIRWQLDDHRGLVSTGALGHFSGSANLNEAGLRILVLADVLGQDSQFVVVGDGRGD